MIDLPYNLVIEATPDADFFGFYSEELDGFTGAGRSVQDCLDRARDGMREHVELLAAQGLPVPPQNPRPEVVIRNEQPGAA